jgi:hypothetical protein
MIWEIQLNRNRHYTQTSRGEAPDSRREIVGCRESRALDPGIPKRLAFLPVARDGMADYKIESGTTDPFMPRILAITLAVVVLALAAWAQDDTGVTFRTEATNAFVWGEENRSGAVSSTVQDPISGNAIHKLRHGGVEVSSRAGFEKVGNEALLSFTTTIVNTTKSEVLVRAGEVIVDGHAALPLSVVLRKKDVRKKDRKGVQELAGMHCFANGFLPNEEFFSSDGSGAGFAVGLNKALTVSLVTKDPRYSSVLCTMEGCYPKGSVRFSVVVNATVFVFIWPGRAMISCGS